MIELNVKQEFKGRCKAFVDASLPYGRNLQYIPFHGHVKLGQIHTHIHHIATLLLIHMSQVNL